MAYFNYKEHACYYEEQGEGTPLIFLHGNTASSKMFKNLASDFEGQYKTVLIDFLGHGKSDRVSRFAPDLWFDEALQVIAFLEQKNYRKVNLIGSSGGALVAINVALERPDLVAKIIADSFEGETPLPEFVENVKEEREASKKDEGAKGFYLEMQGADWEKVVDNDTAAIAEHAATIGKFFHKPLKDICCSILLTGSKEDEFVGLVNLNFFPETYGNLIEKMGTGKIHLFEQGGHPAALSNSAEFVQIALEFLKK